MEDYFQVEVDDFITGEFLFLSAKEVPIKVDEWILRDVQSVDQTGWIVSTYCYTYHCFMKFLIVGYEAKPWHNDYTIRRGFTRTMNIDDMAYHGSEKDYLEWMQPTNP